MIKKHSIIIGVAFIVAIISSIVGGVILEEVFANMVSLQDIENNIVNIHIGVVIELVGAFAVIVVGLYLYKYIGSLNEQLGNAYLSLRILEAIILMFAAIYSLVVINFYHFTDDSMWSELSAYDIGFIISNLRSSMLNTIVPVLFILGGFVFYTAIYQNRLFPRFVAIWGIIGCILILFMNMLTITGTYAIVFALPIILNELFIGVWLIVKGMNVEFTKKIQ